MLFEKWELRSFQISSINTILYVNLAYSSKERRYGRPFKNIYHLNALISIRAFFHLHLVLLNCKYTLEYSPKKIIDFTYLGLL